MATYKIPVPNEKLAPLTNVNDLANITDFPSKLGRLVGGGVTLNNYIDSVSKLTNVPSNLIKLFIFLSSKGDSTYEGKKPFLEPMSTPLGLMGLSPSTAQNTLFKEQNLGRISVDEFGELLKNGVTQPYYNEKIQNTRFNITPSLKNEMANKEVNDFDFYQKRFSNAVSSFLDLSNPKLNVLIGALLLGQMIDKYKGSLEQIIPIYLNLDNLKSSDYQWAKNFRGSNPIDLYNKLTPSGKGALILAMSKGGFLNKFA